MSKKTEWDEAEEAKQILKQQQRDAVEAEKSKMDRKAELLVLERRKQMERVEIEMEEKTNKKLDEVSSLREKQEKEERLASEMSRLLREDEKDQKLREQLRRDVEELRTVQSKIRSAYMIKQLTAQIAEKEAILAQETIEKHKYQKMLEDEIKCMEGVDRLRNYSLKAEKMLYKEDLLAQIEEKNKNNRDGREFELDKAMLNETLRRIHEDEEKEKEAIRQRRNTFLQEIEEFKRQKEIQKQREKAEKEKEEEQFKAYAEEKNKQEENRIKDLKEKEALKNKIRDEISHSYLSKVQSANEREEILTVLAQEEIRQRDFKKDQEKAYKAEKLKAEFQRAIKKNLDEKLLGWKAEYQEQELYKTQLLDNAAKEKALNNSSLLNKATKSTELRKALQDQMQEKHRRQIEEWQRESASEKLQEMEEKERLRKVEEERLRLLKTHATKLIGYLPRGVLREGDLNHLGPEFSDKLKKHIEMNSS